jgi:uncharacterized protein
VGVAGAKLTVMEQRLSLITLGVADARESRDFYTALGWTGETPDDGVFFFQSGWWGGTTLAHCVGSPDEVDQILLDAEAAGATIARPGAATFWDGYSGVFIDPDGHPWEIAHNPGWTIRPDGSTTLR